MSANDYTITLIISISKAVKKTAKGKMRQFLGYFEGKERYLAEKPKQKVCRKISKLISTQKPTIQSFHAMRNA